MSGKVQGLKRLEAMGLLVPDYTVYRYGDQVEGDSFIKPDKRYAVRSSYRAEDGKEDSYAGIFESYLNIQASDVPYFVEQVFDTSLGRRAQAYTEARNLPPLRREAMEVICQEMVQAEVSGLLFRDNPRGLLHEAVIEIAYGLGEDLVNGLSPSQRYFYHKDSKQLHHSENPDAPYLDAKQREELLSLINRLEEPVDIEFAIADEKIYYLQIRPITTLDQATEIVLDNSNISESYPGITLPLSVSFAKLAYKGVFQQLGRRLLGMKIEEEPVWENLAHMVEDYQGHMYYLISNWYGVLQYLPFHKRVIATWQRMLGVENKQVHVGLEAPPWYKKLSFFPRFWRLFRKMPEHMENLEHRFQEIEVNYRREISQGRSPEALRELFSRLEEELLRQWDLTLINDLYAFFYVSLLSDGSQATAQGQKALASMEPILAMRDLANLDPESEAYTEACRSFITRFGDRNMEELKLETKTFRSHPELLEEVVERFREHPMALPIVEETEDPPRGFFQKRWYRKASLGIAYRESSRFNRSRIYGMVREMAWYFGESLTALGFLETAEDVFYLEISEMLAEEDYRPLVTERKAKYEIYKKLPTYPRLVFAGEIVPSSMLDVVGLDQDDSTPILRGTPVSKGKVQGEVIVITTVAEAQAQDTSGKILVAPLTDPAWVYLLVQAKGLICEKGSLLSHTGIISRELGIPCVTGVAKASSILRSGDIVLLDGDQGTVERLDYV